MDRITRNFFVLIGLATLASGGLWQQAVAVDAGRFSPVGLALGFVSLVVLLTALLGALRILYKTAQANRSTPESHLEDTNA